jgi:hypothetical protein
MRFRASRVATLFGNSYTSKNTTIHESPSSARRTSSTGRGHGKIALIEQQNPDWHDLYEELTT